ncbi:MAG: XRE family transcriptional regulator [Verrucomicrobiaceae bacterium]|nr:MAG: XRE family transcriptional regulator [Verrucomicrobiaceae bacterium]
MPAKIDRSEHDVLRELLVAWRNSGGLSQRELSKKLGRAPNYIGRVESGTQGLAVVDMIDLAEAVHRRPIDLFTEYCQALEVREGK